MSRDQRMATTRRLLARFRVGSAIVLPSALLLVGCGSPLVSSGGPTAGQIERGAAASQNIRMMDVTAEVTSRIIEVSRPQLFSATLPPAMPVRQTVNPGDQLDISLWEAPPGFLFGSALMASGSSALASSGQSTVVLPGQMVDDSGRVSVPFAGMVQAAGRTPSQIATDIRHRLEAKAHQPQAIVRIAKNINQTATVVGEVGNPTAVSLTPKGERLLDAIAVAGGLRQSPSLTTVQVSRGNITQALPMDMVIRDPNQNVVLSPQDVITILYQPFSFTALGATSKNEEVHFEGTGLTLAQALGRIGGLKDDRANIKGVFLFRLEDPSVSGPYGNVPAGEKVPTIYRLDMRDPGNFFLAQRFPVKNQDIIYVSNAPISDFQKVFGAMASVIMPALTTAVLLNQTNNR